MEIAIIIEDGVVHQVISDQAANVIIIDRDVHDIDDDDIKTILGNDAYIHKGTQECDVNPKIIAQIKKEAY